MSSRQIQNMKLGKKVKYFDKNYVVVDVYPYIAYLRAQSNDGEDINSSDANATLDKNELGRVICVGLGDLVMAGLEPSMIESMRRPERDSFKKEVREHETASLAST